MPQEPQLPSEYQCPTRDIPDQRPLSSRELPLQPQLETEARRSHKWVFG